MDLPEEIVYKILSYLPGTNLTQLKLSNKQYWNVFRQNNSCLWRPDIKWIEKINLKYTTKMFLENQLHVQSLAGLQYGGARYQFDNKAEFYFCTNFNDSNKLFQSYVYNWGPPQMNHDIDGWKTLPTYFTRCSKMTHIKHPQIIRLFRKHFQKYIDASLYEVDDEMLKIPPAFVAFYLKEKPDLHTETIELTDEVKVDGFIIWVVVLISDAKTRREIGRAVCAHDCFQHLTKVHQIDGEMRVTINESSEGKFIHLIRHALIISEDA